MSESDVFGLFSLLILFCLVGWWYFVQGRFLVRRYRSQHWPMLDATLQKGAVGSISFGKGASAPAVFVGYSHVVQGTPYAGFFALYADRASVQDLHEILPGARIQIRYGPSDPNVSFLANYDDPRFGGLKATQNPEWLDQAPAFDLQDAIRGSRGRNT